MDRLDFRPKKRLGQHFLIDESVLGCIISAAGLSPGDTVIEVGPGLGILTGALARCGARVIAVELDSKLVALLRRKMAPFPDVEIVHADILKVSPQRLLQDSRFASGSTQSYKVIANLPYYITSPVLSHFLEAQCKPSEMVVMVQREVGETIAADPGRMRLLSVKAQFYSRPAVVCRVPPSSFHPRPKVDSVVLRLEVYAEPPIDVSDVSGFFDLVGHGFSAPRKQLRNSLAHSLAISPTEAAVLLERAAIEGRRRAETLSLEEWRQMWLVFAPQPGGPGPDDASSGSPIGPGSPMESGCE